MTGLMTLAAVAWGALAFGAVYPWAYWPLMVWVALTGMLGLWIERGVSDDKPPTALLGAIGVVALAIALQLVPLPATALSRLSPATHALLLKSNLPYSQGLAAHSLSIRPDATARSLAFLSALTLFLAGLTRSLHSGGLRRLTARLAGLGLFMALVAIVQKATVRGPKIYGFWTPLQGTEPFGSFVNKHHFAGWMLMTLSLAIGVVCAGIARGVSGRETGWRHRLLWLSSRNANQLGLAMLTSLIMGVALVLSLSRSGITAFVLAIIVSGWLVGRRQASASRRAIGALYLGVVIAVAVGWVGVDTVAKRFEHGSWDTLSDRVGVWRDAAHIIRDMPITGAGLNAFGDAMIEYQRFQLGLHYAQAHNDYLQLAAEGGLLVGIPILAAVFLLVREIRSRFRDGSDDVSSYWIRVGATTGLAAIALQEVVDFSLQMPGNAVLFTVLAAIAVHRPAKIKRA